MTDDEKQIQPHVIRLRDDAAGWRREGGRELTPADPFLTGLDEGAAEGLVQTQWALVHSTVEEAEAHRYGTVMAPFEPSDYTVDDLEVKLEEEAYESEELDALYEAEEEGEGRESALEAIENTTGIDEPVMTPEDTDTSESTDDEDDEAAADTEADAEGGDDPEGEEGEEEAAEAPFDPSEYTVDDLEAEVESGDYSEAELDALYAAEEAGGNRSTAKEAIDEERNGGE